MQIYIYTNRKDKKSIFLSENIQASNLIISIIYIVLILGAFFYPTSESKVRKIYQTSNKLWQNDTVLVVLDDVNVKQPIIIMMASSITHRREELELLILDGAYYFILL